MTAKVFSNPELRILLFGNIMDLPLVHLNLICTCVVNNWDDILKMNENLLHNLKLSVFIKKGNIELTSLNKLLSGTHIFLNEYCGIYISAVLTELFISRFQMCMTNQEIPIIRISNLICLDISDIILWWFNQNVIVNNFKELESWTLVMGVRWSRINIKVSCTLRVNVSSISPIPDCCSNVGSLTCCATRELPIETFLNQ